MLNLSAPFNFEFTLKKAPNLSWQVSRVDLPDISLPAVTMSYPTSDMPVPGDKMEYSPLAITLKMDEKMQSYKEIFDWMQSISLSRGWFNNGDMKSDAVLIVNDSNKLRVASFLFEDLWPTSLSSISFDYSASDDPIEITATFVYRRFDFIEV